MTRAHYECWFSDSKAARARLMDALVNHEVTVTSWHRFGKRRGDTVVLMIGLDPHSRKAFYEESRVAGCSWKPPEYLDKHGTLRPMYDSPEDEARGIVSAGYSGWRASK